jgi:hypothetical protein
MSMNREFLSPAAATAVAARAALLAALALLAGCTPLGVLGNGPLLGKKAPQSTPVVVTSPALGRMSVADIQATFGTGVAFSETVVGGKTYSMVLSIDGTAKRTAAGAKTAESGTWRAANAGYCSKWGTKAEECYAVEKTAATTYDVLDAKNKVIAHFTQ